MLCCTCLCHDPFWLQVPALTITTHFVSRPWDSLPTPLGRGGCAQAPAFMPIGIAWLNSYLFFYFFSGWVAWLRLRWDAAPVASRRSAAPGWPFDPNSPSDCHRQCPIEKPRARFSTHLPALSFIFMLFKILGPLDVLNFSVFIQVRLQFTRSLFPCRVVAGVFLAPAITFIIPPGFLISQSFGFYYPYVLSGRAGRYTLNF